MCFSKKVSSDPTHRFKTNNITPNLIRLDDMKPFCSLEITKTLTIEISKDPKKTINNIFGKSIFCSKNNVFKAKLLNII